MKTPRVERREGGCERERVAGVDDLDPCLFAYTRAQGTGDGRPRHDVHAQFRNLKHQTTLDRQVTPIGHDNLRWVTVATELRSQAHELRVPY